MIHIFYMCFTISIVLGPVQPFLRGSLSKGNSKLDVSKRGDKKGFWEVCGEVGQDWGGDKVKKYAAWHSLFCPTAI